MRNGRPPQPAAAPDKRWRADPLWPAAEPDDARKSLDMTVARLRQLLGGDARVKGAEERLRRAPQAVWSDGYTATATLAAPPAARDARMRGDAVPADAATAWQRMLAVYRRPLSTDADDPPALLAARAPLAQALRATLVVEAQDGAKRAG